MSTVTAIYTGTALVGPVSAYFKERYPDHDIVNVLDDGLIRSVIKAGRMTDAVLRQIYSYCREARDAGSDVILQTCSSVGQSVDLIQPFFDIPVLRIDSPMVLEAVKNYKKIGVLATLPTTLDPTMALVEQTAIDLGKKIGTEKGLASGAFDALSRGNVEEHDRKIMETALSLSSSCDVFLLAQGSMARMKEALSSTLGKPVLTSPRSGVDALSSYLGGVK